MTARYSIKNHTFVPVLSGGVQIPPFTLKGPVNLADISSDYNTFYGVATDIMVEWIDPPLGMPTQMTLAEWQAITGQDSYSALFPYPLGSIVTQNVARYREDTFYHTQEFIPGLCCAQFWFCTGTVGPDPCVDPTLAHFIQHVQHDAGPAGWSGQVIHAEADALYERWTYCGDCNEDGLLDPFPVTKT